MGEAAPCGPQARGLFIAPLRIRGDTIVSILFLFHIPESHYMLFTRPHFFHFQIIPRIYFSDTIPFRFQISRFHDFTISDSRITMLRSIHTLEVSLNKRNITGHLHCAVRDTHSRGRGRAVRRCAPRSPLAPL